MTEGKKTPVQVAAETGTLLAMWESYRDNVCHPLPGYTPLHADASRLDFYSGALSVFYVVRAMVEHGHDAQAAVQKLIAMEIECNEALQK